jgi:hypothetical protein
MMTLAKRVLLLSVILAVTALAGWGQQLNVGGITGTVRDSSGAVIPDVAVTVENHATGLKQATRTTEAGVYFTSLLPIGKYTVTATKNGFVTVTRSEINVFGGQTLSVDFELTVGAVTQQVEVTAEAPVLDTTSAHMGVTESEKLIGSLPITLIGQAARSAIQSVAYLPGVASVSSGGQSWTIISRAQINGVPPGMFGYEIDGLYAGAGAAESAEERVTPVPEQIAEVRLTNNTDASQGFNGGVSLDMVSKSGTSELHGTAYYYVRNQSLNARNFFLPVRPQDQQNNWGFNVAGPVKLPYLYSGRHKTFFLAAMDWFKFRFTSSPTNNIVTSSVPTEAMRRGDFREWLGPQIGTDAIGRPILRNQIYDPTTTRSDGRGGFIRDPFMFNGQLNVIDPARLSDISKKFQNGYALPVLPGIAENWKGLSRESLIDKDQLSWKIDHQIGDKHRFSFSYERQIPWFHDGPVESGFRSGNNGHFYINGGDAYLDASLSNGFIDDRDMYRLRFNYVWTAQPNVLFNFRAGVNRSTKRRNGQWPSGANSPASGVARQYGLTGTLTGNTPQVTIDGVNGFGLGFEGALMADQDSTLAALAAALLQTDRMQSDGVRPSSAPSAPPVTEERPSVADAVSRLLGPISSRGTMLQQESGRG